MILTLVLLPLVLGLFGYVLSTHTALRKVSAGVIAAGVLVIIGDLWGLPPLPPVSSKHKVFYLLLISTLIAPLISRRPVVFQFLAILALVVTSFLWLNWRRLANGVPIEPLLLSSLSLATISFAFVKSEAETQRPFLWPVALFAALLGMAGVGFLSGYLGLGQIAAGVTAYFGGLLLIPFVMGLLNKASDLPNSLLWVGFTTFGILATALASFATNLNPLAFIWLPLALLSPLIATRIPLPKTPALHPFVFAATALPWAGAGILTAFINF